MSSIDVFKGRTTQIRRILDAIESPGRHPVLFGQRGVGKTSLVNLLRFFAEGEETDYVRLACDTPDSFESIWRRVLNRIFYSYAEEGMGLVPDMVQYGGSLAQRLDGGAVTPSAVADLLEEVQRKTVVVLDEFDRITDLTARTFTADLIKHLSDSNPRVTLVIVGVAASIGELVGEHPSISRNLVQIEMPKMSAEEIRDILKDGFDTLLIEVEEGVLDEATALADGFPHYAHLLGLTAFRACEARRTKLLTRSLFESLGCELAIEESIETFRSAFTKATRTQQASRHAHVLCACALAGHDDDGVFAPAAVAEAMKEHFGIDTKGKRLTPTLGEFCEGERGPVLREVPVGTRKMYRFIDPMMRPFLRIRSKAYKGRPGNESP